MNTNPKFAVGERVMVRSVHAPELNCDNVVVDIAVYLKKGERTRMGIWTFEAITDGWKYFISEIDEGFEESALRPRPEAGDDFNTLIRSLKLEQGEPA